MELELRSVEHQGAHEIGGAQGGRARPLLSWTGCGLPGLDSFASIFYIFQKLSPWIFRSFRELLSVRVSSIQIMQVRVQNKGKSVWKSRYVGDVSLLMSVDPN